MAKHLSKAPLAEDSIAIQELKIDYRLLGQIFQASDEMRYRGTRMGGHPSAAALTLIAASELVFAIVADSLSKDLSSSQSILR
jgi:hypothetical protein